MHKAIVVFEVEGGSDKYFDGHRKDTMPIVNSILETGWYAEVVYFRLPNGAKISSPMFLKTLMPISLA